MAVGLMRGIRGEEAAEEFAERGGGAGWDGSKEDRVHKDCINKGGRNEVGVKGVSKEPEAGGDDGDIVLTGWGGAQDVDREVAQTAGGVVV